ncbi:hypothetical protein [Nocardia sp. IFM 10818]
MKSLEEHETAAHDVPPFSNGTEWEIWQYGMCMGGGTQARRCVNDDNDDCPLIALAVTGRTPAEWTGPHGRYQCGEKTTPAQARTAAAQARREADTELQRRIDESHYPMFDLGEQR